MLSDRNLRRRNATAIILCIAAVLCIEELLMPKSSWNYATVDEREYDIDEDLLETDEQLHRVDACKNFGWALQFIRQPLFLPPTVVMVDANDTETWEITEEGALAPFSDIRH